MAKILDSIIIMQIGFVVGMLLQGYINKLINESSRHNLNLLEDSIKIKDELITYYKKAYEDTLEEYSKLQKYFNSK